MSKIRTSVYNNVHVDSTVSEARAALPEIPDRVEHGDEVTITRHGRAVATVVRPDAPTVRRAGAVLSQAEQLREVLEQGRRTPLSELPGIAPDRAAELLEEVRWSRNR